MEQIDLATQILALQQENNKLRRINAALVERVESGASQSSDSYTAFRHSVVLAEQVRERTDALNQTMADLKRSNTLLSDARHTAECASAPQSSIESAVKALYCLIKPRIVLLIALKILDKGLSYRVGPACMR